MDVVFSKEELSKIFEQDVSENVYDICVNSKEAKIGDLFVALQGEKVDGHKFVADALKNGAALALVEKKIDGIDDSKLIITSSSYDGLLKLAKYNLSVTGENIIASDNQSNSDNSSTCAIQPQYIAVTGSVGKTTTKNMIHHILKNVCEKNSVYVSRKNFNSQIGLPICAATMPRSTKTAIFEMGMSESGGIKKLTDIVKPSVAVITCIGETHLEFFESVLDIAKAKAEIFERSPEVAIIPSDSAYSDFLRDRAMACGVKNIISFGENQNANARIISCKLNNDSIAVTAQFRGKTFEYQLACKNMAIAQNSLAATIAAHVTSGIDDLTKLANTLEDFPFTSNRNEITVLENRNITIIDDSYNAAPTSMRAALKSLGTCYGDRRKIAVVGDMLELGKNAASYHKNLAATIGKYNIDLVFACGDLSKQLFDNLPESRKGFWAENSHKLAENILQQIQDGDCILVKGSHSMNMGYIVDVLKNLN